MYTKESINVDVKIPRNKSDSLPPLLFDIRKSRDLTERHTIVITLYGEWKKKNTSRTSAID